MAKHSLTDIAFTENGPIDIAQFQALHRLIGWDPRRQQTEAKTAEMLRLNHYHIAAHTKTGQLVGFARVCGDPYIAQVLDVITHPHFRRRGIATRCMAGVLAYLLRSDYISVTLTDGSGLADFYQPFGFMPLEPGTPGRFWQRDKVTFQLPADMRSPEQRIVPRLDSPKKVIGILGGISHESTIYYYDLILKKYYALKKDYYYPEIVIHSLNFQRFTDFENSGDRMGYIQEIMSGIEALERAGVDFILMAANSPHAVYHDIARRTLLPVISIVDETVRYAQRHHLQRLLLLGIKYTMQAGFYPTACQNAGLETIIPTLEEQEVIDQIIFTELVLGIFKSESKQILCNIIEQYDVDGVILGCTELPLIIKQHDLAIHVIDTLDVHAEAALQYALSS